MKKVFAVLIFLPLLSGCSQFQNMYYAKTSLSSGNNIIYSAHGDFDGDKRSEHLTIINKDNKLAELQLQDGSKIYNQELSININNINPQLSDINNDKHDDIVVCSNDNGAVSMFVYTFSNRIHTLFSPQTLEQNISFKEINEGYMISGGSIENFIKSSEKLNLNFYLTELDNTSEKPMIITEGTISSLEGKIISLVLIQFSFDSHGQTQVKDIQLKPYIEVNID